MEATGPDKRIEGSILVDLCMQRSGRRESGCDAPNASEELPTPVASPPRTPTPPAAQVRQYSWRHYAKKEVCSYDIRREFVGANKQTNRSSPSLSQQAPLIAKAHLMAVVRRVEQKERTKGKQLGEFVFKNLPQSRGKNLRPVVPSRQKSEAENQQYSVIRDNAERSNSELNQLVHVPQYANNIHTLKPLKARKEEGDLKFKCPGSTNCQNHNDVNVNKPVVARKRCAQKKHSLVSKKGFLKSTLSVCSQTFTKVALMLAVVISILGGVLNVRLPGRISTSGPASLVCQECEYGNNSNSAHPLSFAILRESAAAIVNLSKGLCSRISKVMFLTGSKQLAGSMNMLQNTLRRGVTIVSRFSRPRELARPCAPSRSNRYSARSERAMTGNVLAGKRLNTYIFPSADFWASRVYYLDTYTINLEFDDDFPVVYDLLYIYIYIYLLPFVVILYLGNIPKGYLIYFGLFFLKFGCSSNRKS